MLFLLPPRRRVRNAVLAARHPPIRALALYHVRCTMRALHSPSFLLTPAVFAIDPLASRVPASHGRMRDDIVSVDVDRSQIVWMALVGCALGPRRKKNPAAVPPCSLARQVSCGCDNVLR